MGETENMRDEAKALLSALIYPKSEAKMTEAEKLAFGEAVILEEKYLSEMSGSAGARAVKSETVGDVSVTYDLSYDVSGGKSPPVRVPISEAVYAALMTAGLLSAWV